LGLHAGVEAGVGEGDAEPGQEARDGRHVGEPVEHLARARVDAHVRQQRKERGEDECRYGQPVAARLFEYRGCISCNREAICVLRYSFKSSEAKWQSIKVRDNAARALT
jgi:hypothetical protein